MRLHVRGGGFRLGREVVGAELRFMVECRALGFADDALVIAKVQYREIPRSEHMVYRLPEHDM